MWVISVIFVLLFISFGIGMYANDKENDLGFQLREFLSIQLFCFGLITFVSFVICLFSEAINDKQAREQREEKAAFDDGMNDSTNGLPYNNRWSGNAYDQYRNGFVTGKKGE